MDFIVYGDVAKRSKAKVCKTFIHRFESDRRLFFLRLLKQHFSPQNSVFGPKTVFLASKWGGGEQVAPTVVTPVQGYMKDGG